VGGEKSVNVTFTTGQDVLRAYWGFLSNGGLVIPGGHGLKIGDPVALRVTIESSNKEYTLRGQVVGRPELVEAAPDRAVIEFQPGEPHDLLLSAAWAETDNVPARRHRRRTLDRMVFVQVPLSLGLAEGTLDNLRVSADQAPVLELPGRLLNLSLGGCCVHVQTGGKKIAPGSIVHLHADGVRVPGLIKWSRADDVGVEFVVDDAARPEIERFVKKFL
jgi:Tfp pilus assembly protein PilZ